VHGGGGGGGPSAFKGNQTGIGSWFNANNDGTNGNSWCGYPYNNASPVFAPDITQMTNGTNAVWPNPLWSTYGKIYCGLEATVKDGNTGNVMTMYIGDAFDHQWVRTPGSIDIMSDSWSKLHNMPANNKNASGAQGAAGQNNKNQKSGAAGAAGANQKTASGAQAKGMGADGASAQGQSASAAHRAGQNEAAGQNARSGAGARQNN